MRQWQFHELNSGPRRLIVTRGKHKGYVGEAVSNGYGSTVRFESLGNDDIPYKNVEWTKHDDTPDLRGMMDMTGRDIEVGTWIAYSVPNGSSSHGLEIGKVKAITDAGTLTVIRSLKNGTKVGTTSRWDHVERRVGDADRCLALPVDEVTMTTWVLKGFTDLKDDF